VRLTDFHRARGFAAAFALLGVVLFTALVPGHLVSQATAFALDAESGSAAEMPCHEGMAMPATTPKPDRSDTPQEKCPFCKGYAAFMSVLAIAPDAGVIAAERVRIASRMISEGAVEHIAKQTNNRGPPSIL
jgi:hypothetical protein